MSQQWFFNPLRLSLVFFFSSRRRHTRFKCDWSSDVCSSDLLLRVDQGVDLLICRGTVEEKIDALIDSKQGLSDELLTGGDEINLTEMTNDDIIDRKSVV